MPQSRANLRSLRAQLGAVLLLGVLACSAALAHRLDIDGVKVVAQVSGAAAAASAGEGRGRGGARDADAAVGLAPPNAADQTSQLFRPREPGRHAHPVHAQRHARPSVSKPEEEAHTTGHGHVHVHMLPATQRWRSAPARHRPDVCLKRGPALHPKRSACACAVQVCQGFDGGDWPHG